MMMMTNMQQQQQIQSNSNSIIDGSSFPVVFFDGERETNIGSVIVFPSMSFKYFQSIISNKIGISPHQITIYLDNNNHHHIHHHNNHRKIPVTSKFNFASLISSDDSSSAFFRAVLKRSRRTRRRTRTPHQIHNPKFMEPEDDFYDGYSRNFNFSPENFVLLKRGVDNINSGLLPNPGGLYSGGLYSDYLDYEIEARVREIERKRYLASLSMNSDVYSDLDYQYSVWDSGRPRATTAVSSEFDDGASSSGGSRDKVYCEVCKAHNATGETPPPFHFCQNDEVITGFFGRPRAGPIARPTKPNATAETAAATLDGCDAEL